MNSSNPSALTRSVLLYTWGGGILRRTVVVLLESSTYMNSSNPSALTRSVLLYTWGGGHIEENCGCSVGEQHIHELEQSFSTYKVSIIIYMGGGILRRTVVVLLESSTYMNSSNPSALTRSVLLYTWGGHIEENCGCSVGEQHIHELEQSFSTYKVSIIIYMGGAY